jgi:hypothetical protein
MQQYHGAIDRSIALTQFRTRQAHYFFSKFFRRQPTIAKQKTTTARKKRQSTMGGKGNPHLDEKKKIAKQYLRAVYEQGGLEGLGKVKPTDCWACHPAELSKGNYTVSAWGSLFNRIKQDAKQEAESCGQLSSFPSYSAEMLPDCFKTAGSTGAGGADNGASTGGGNNGASAGGGNNGTSAGGGANNKGKFDISSQP